MLLSTMLEVSHPQLTDKTFGKILHEERIFAYGGEYTGDELQLIHQVIKEASGSLGQELTKNKKEGFTLAIAINDEAILTIQLGTIDQDQKEYGKDGKKLKYADFARSKVQFLQLHKKCSRSSQNPEMNIGDQIRTHINNELVVGGAVTFTNGLIIGISGLSSIAKEDEDAVLKIGKNLGFKEAI